MKWRGSTVSGIPSGDRISINSKMLQEWDKNPVSIKKGGSYG